MAILADLGGSRPPGGGVARDKEQEKIAYSRIGYFVSSFINRKRELAALSNHLPGNGAHLFVLWGRRRVGKSELLRRHFQDRNHLFFTGDLTNSEFQLKELSQRLGGLWNDSFLSAGHIRTWPEFFAYPAIQSQPLDLVLDEFPYLCEAEPALPSLLQKHWDQHWRHGQVRLALCGSSISFMEKQVLSERSPLFGRRTAQMRLRPLSVWDAQEFLPQYTAEEIVETFACVGGIPAYLNQIDGSRPLGANLVEKVFAPTSYLYEEPRLLLHQELREPRTYFSILRALAAGRTQPNEIAQEVGLDGRRLSSYLNTLIGLELVERIVPITENPDRSRRGLYRIRDPFLRFWFRFVQPYRSEVEAGQVESLWSLRIAPHLSHFISQTFEDLCAEWVRRNPPQLPFRPDRVGRWWDRQNEIDVVAYNDEEVLFGECKWTRSAPGPSALAHLMATAERIPGFEQHKRHYALFSRSPWELRLTDAIQIDLATLFS